MDISKSDIIISLAGRDKDQLFFVLDTDETYVYLADGRARRLEQPKRKKHKHLPYARDCWENGHGHTAGISKVWKVE